MRSFSAGLWVGFVAGAVFMALWQQADRESATEEYLPGPSTVQSFKQQSVRTAPDNLATKLAQQTESVT